MPHMPKLYIIAGCNGAGKTTASYTVLPEMLDCREFVNADEIAKGLSPFNPESVAIDAGRLMLQRMDDLLIAGEDFAFETTLATRSYVKFIDQAHAMGYFVSLLFFWLPTPELAIVRVATRVSKGGHDIPEEDPPPLCHRHAQHGRTLRSAVRLLGHLRQQLRRCRNPDHRDGRERYNKAHRKSVSLPTIHEL